MSTKLLAALALAGALTACGGGGGAGGGGSGGSVAVVEPQPVVLHPLFENLQHPTISGLEFFNGASNNQPQLTTATGQYYGYAAGDIVTFVLGDIVLFNVPGDLPHPYTSLYEADAYPISVLHSDTAVENLMAFLLAIDDDGDYTNGIQIAGAVRAAARGLRVDFNQSEFNFRTDPAVQFAVSVLSSNTVYGSRLLLSPNQARAALGAP